MAMAFSAYGKSGSRAAVSGKSVPAVKSPAEKSKTVHVTEEGKFACTVPSGSIKVSGSLQGAPAIGTVSRSKRGSARFADRWLQVDIQFSFQFPAVRERSMYFLNRPSVELYMGNFLPGKRWFYGVQNLHSILLDTRYKTKKYNVSLFLPPNYVHAYVPREKKSEKFDLKTLEGVVLIRSGRGKVLGSKAFSFRRNLTKRDSAALIRQYETLWAQRKISALFFPREKTPWQWVASDEYELPATALSVGSEAGKTGKGEE
ncbi:MAG: hypothetical protein J6S58_09700 [Lentisphaeria bacterium]|nr:hypothetical protein [Lentisphaeria bacterium]